MRRLCLCISIFVFGFLFNEVTAQDKCPQITVSGPSGNTLVGNTMLFSVSVDVPDQTKLGYKWTVDQGKIEEGINSPHIVVRTTSELSGVTVQAWVEVTGLPAGCSNKGSESGPVISGGGLPLLAEFDVFTGKRYKSELDTVAKEMGDRPGWLLYVISYRSPGESSQTVTRRVNGIKQYLGKIHNIEASRMVFIDGGTKFRSVKIYAIPPKDYSN